MKDSILSDVQKRLSQATGRSARPKLPVYVVEITPGPGLDARIFSSLKHKAHIHGEISLAFNSPDLYNAYIAGKANMAARDRAQIVIDNRSRRLKKELLMADHHSQPVRYCTYGDGFDHKFNIIGAPNRNQYDRIELVRRRYTTDKYDHWLRRFRVKVEESRHPWGTTKSAAIFEVQVPKETSILELERQYSIHKGKHQMSKDRVKFTVMKHESTTLEFRSKFRKCFGIDLPEFSQWQADRHDYVCRPSQYARFLILLADGAQAVTTFNAKLLILQPQVPMVDVSDHPSHG